MALCLSVSVTIETAERIKLVFSMGPFHLVYTVF